MVCISNYYLSKKIFFPLDTTLRDTTPKLFLIIFLDLPERIVLAFPKIIDFDLDALKPATFCPQEEQGIIYYIIILYISTITSSGAINTNLNI